MYSLYPEEGSIFAKPLVKTLLNSIDFTIFKLTQVVCSTVEGSFFYLYTKDFGHHWSIHETLGCSLMALTLKDSGNDTCSKSNSFIQGVDSFLKLSTETCAGWC